MASNSIGDNGEEAESGGGMVDVSTVSHSVPNGFSSNTFANINNDQNFDSNLNDNECHNNNNNNNNYNYQLTRLNHSSKMSQTLESMFNEEQLCDVTIVCNGQSVKAHRVILAACSDYFKEIFHSAPIGFNPIVFLKNFTIEDLNDLLEFVYKGELVVPYNRLESLIESAKSLGIVGLNTLRFNDQSCTLNDVTIRNSDENSVFKSKNNCDVDLDAQTNADGDNESSDLLKKQNLKPTSTGKKRGRKGKILSTSNQTKSQGSDLNNSPEANSHHANGPNNLDNNEATVGTNENKHAIDLSSLRSRSSTKSDNNGNKNSKRDLGEVTTNITNETLPNGSSAPTIGKMLRSRTSIETANHHSTCDLIPKNDANSPETKSDPKNVDSMDSTSDNKKITKSKLRSWSQQIMEKNIPTLKSTLNVPKRVTGGDETAMVVSNGISGHNDNLIIQNNGRYGFSALSCAPSSSQTTTTMVELVPRPRGRPKKIITTNNNSVPQFKPIITNGNVPHILQNGNSQNQSPPMKRKRGRPPLYRPDPSKTSSPSSSTKLTSFHNSGFTLIKKAFSASSTTALGSNEVTALNDDVSIKKEPIDDFKATNGNDSHHTIKGNSIASNGVGNDTTKNLLQPTSSSSSTQTNGQNVLSLLP